MRVPAVALLRFWTMLAHSHGQIWNAAEPAKELGVDPSTTRRHLDLSTDALMVRPLQPCFWATHPGAEIDLLLRRGDRLLGVECKRADAPRLTASIHIALEDLGLERVAVVYPGAKRYPSSEQVEVVPLDTLAEPGRLFGEAVA